jgi:hypothetical protein
LENLDVPHALVNHVVDELGTDLNTISYFIGRE